MDFGLIYGRVSGIKASYSKLYMRSISLFLTKR